MCRFFFEKFGFRGVVFKKNGEKKKRLLLGWLVLPRERKYRVEKRREEREKGFRFFF